MIRTGQIQELRILRRTEQGWIVGDEDDAEALLPLDEIPGSRSDDDSIRVFVYRASDRRLLATTKPPKVQVGGFASLKVLEVNDAGAYLDWGMPTNLFIPKADQKKPLVEDRWYVVRVALDAPSDTIYGSTRIEDLLDNTDLSVRESEKVELVVFGKSDLGFSVVVNNVHQGLVHLSDVFKPVSIGDRITGFVKTVREDNKLDIALQPIGYRQFIDVNTAMLAKRLQGSSGFLPLNDKSSAEEIYAEFGISKKAFKKALGALYKERLVRIEEEGIVWVG